MPEYLRKGVPPVGTMLSAPVDERGLWEETRNIFDRIEKWGSVSRPLPTPCRCAGKWGCLDKDLN